MNESILAIPLANLALSFLPVLAVIGILFWWSLDYRNALYAGARMVSQLLVIGYVLLFIFASESVWLVLGVVAVMILAASWIALTPLVGSRRGLYAKALLSIGMAGSLVLALVTQGVLDLAPWHAPRYVIPLAGMIFANAMNTVSLGAERFFSELDSSGSYERARDIAFRASLIPNVNSFFAVGLVSLPGMMTGQILAGVSPLIAVRYQIMVMCMIFGTAGLAAACFLALLRRPLARRHVVGRAAGLVALAVAGLASSAVAQDRVADDFQVVVLRGSSVSLVQGTAGELPSEVTVRPDPRARSADADEPDAPSAARPSGRPEPAASPVTIIVAVPYAAPQLSAASFVPIHRGQLLRPRPGSAVGRSRARGIARPGP